MLVVGACMCVEVGGLVRDEPDRVRGTTRVLCFEFGQFFVQMKLLYSADGF